jgi:hypothetical protein
MNRIEKRRTTRALALSTSTMIVLSLGGLMPSVAQAQSSSAPLLDSQHPTIGPMPAPVGPRQPRQKDLPPSVTRKQDDAPVRQRGIDPSLTICRC